MVIAFLFLQIAQIFGKHDKINDNGQIRKPPIITGRFMQICVHIKIRAEMCIRDRPKPVIKELSALSGADTDF